MSQDAESNRRPLAVRKLGLIHLIARALARSGITPNQISIMSVVFAALGFGALFLHGATAWQAPWQLLCAAFCIQLRLLCNLFDGMVAVEGGKKTPAGELFNDVPDRIADPLIIVGIGLTCASAYGMTLAWLCALLAVMTAYVRVLGVSMGAPADFRGPMAKQHRMALLTLALLAVFMLDIFTHVTFQSLYIVFDGALAMMLVGLLITLWRRLAGIYRYCSGT